MCVGIGGLYEHYSRGAVAHLSETVCIPVFLVTLLITVSSYDVLKNILG